MKGAPRLSAWSRQPGLHGGGSEAGPQPKRWRLRHNHGTAARKPLSRKAKEAHGGFTMHGGGSK